MNASPSTPFQNQVADSEEGTSLAEYLDIVLDHIWFIIGVVAAALVIGIAYSLLATPVYESNFSVQVEDSDKSAGSFLGDAASSLLSVKTPSAGEIEVIRSRLILNQAVENTKLYIRARPRYAPLFGAWMARRSSELSEPGFLGLSGYVTGTEAINVPRFDVPLEFEGERFVLTMDSPNTFSVTNPDLPAPIKGKIGEVASVKLPKGQIHLLVSSLTAKPGAQFVIYSDSKQKTLNALQDALKVVEKGKQSGVIDVTLQSPNPQKLTLLLSEIGRLYVRQNIDRKAAEAEKTLGFLNTELPKFKTQLEQSEDIYNRYRNQNGTISLDDEAKNALTQTVDLQSKLIDAQQKRRDLASRFTDKHPSVITLDEQIVAWKSEIANIDGRIRKMPLLQQNTLRMQRDIKVNTDLYVTLLNNSLQMRLAKEGKVGNVRLLDEPVLPEEAVKPNKAVVISLALFLGLFVGIATSIMRSSLFGGVHSPEEIEFNTGLSVYSSIPLSAPQLVMEKNAYNKGAGMHVLAVGYPEDPAVESLRSLRTALQFAMLQASNNRILISGPTPGVGKTFISINFAAIAAASGKRVLLVDADLRKGRINQFFSLPRAPGLAELIMETGSTQKIVRRQVLPNLDLITTGKLPSNPAELLNSAGFMSIMEQASESYDLVVVDTAPVLVAADTAAVSAQMGLILLVARAGKTQLGEMNESIRRLNHAGGKASGVVLNAMDLTRRHYGSYGYKYGAYRYTQYKYGSPGE